MRVLLPLLFAVMLHGYEAVPFGSARASALGNATSALTGVVGMNPAAIGFSRGLQFSASYYTPYMEGDILYYGASAAWGNSWSSFAAAFRSYSLSFFSDMTAEGMHAFNPLPDLAVGYAFDYHAIAIDDVRKSSFAFDAGAQWRLGFITLGAGVIALTFAGDALYAEELSFFGGAAVSIMSNITMLADVRVNGALPVFRAGTEIMLFDLLALRAGVSSEPVFSGGLGLTFGGAAIDYALTYHDLGLTHVVSASYSFTFDAPISNAGIQQ